MSRYLVASLVVTLAVMVCIAPSLAQDAEVVPPKLERTKEQANLDALAIQTLYKQYAEVFQGVYGGASIGETSVEGTLKLCAEQLPKLQNLQETVLPEIEPVLARVTELWARPGAEDEARAQEDFDQAQFATSQSGEIEWNMKLAASDNGAVADRDLPEQFDNLSNRYGELAHMLSNVRKTRVANAEYLADWVKNAPAITFFVQNQRVARMTEWKTFLQWAVKFDPANEYANTRLATMDAELATLQKSVDKEIDTKQWAGPMEGFPGPGSVAQLTQVAIKFFRQDKGWGSPGKNSDGTTRPAEEIVAVAIRGGWKVAETDVFGRVISWRLPVHLAVTRPDLKAKNIARVFELSLVTEKGAPNRVSKAPPFDGCWVGNSWLMRLSKVPQAK